MKFHELQTIVERLAESPVVHANTEVIIQCAKDWHGDIIKDTDDLVSVQITSSPREIVLSNTPSPCEVGR